MPTPEQQRPEAMEIAGIASNVLADLDEFFSSDDSSISLDELRLLIDTALRRHDPPVHHQEPLPRQRQSSQGDEQQQQQQRAEDTKHDPLHQSPKRIPTVLPESLRSPLTELQRLRERKNELFQEQQRRRISIDVRAPSTRERGRRETDGRSSFQHWGRDESMGAASDRTERSRRHSPHRRRQSMRQPRQWTPSPSRSSHSRSCSDDSDTASAPVFTFDSRSQHQRHQVKAMQYRDVATATEMLEGTILSPVNLGSNNNNDDDDDDDDDEAQVEAIVEPNQRVLVERACGTSITDLGPTVLDLSHLTAVVPLPTDKQRHNNQSIASVRSLVHSRSSCSSSSYSSSSSASSRSSAASFSSNSSSSRRLQRRAATKHDTKGSPQARQQAVDNESTTDAVDWELDLSNFDV